MDGFQVAIVAVFIAILGPSALPAAWGSSLPPSGIIIPLYSPPSQFWSLVIQAKQANPGLPFIMIVNPASGPGTSKQSNFTNGIERLKSVGVLVFGYVYTDYGKADLAAVEREVCEYKSWYGVDGIFFDAMPDVPGYERYYSTIGSYSRSLGLYTAGNPGSPLPGTYMGAMDLYVIDEGRSPPNATELYPREISASIIYGVSALTPSYVQSVSALSGYVYITDNSEPDPYQALPSYFTKLVSILSGSVDGPSAVGSAQGGVSPTSGQSSEIPRGGPVPPRLFVLAVTGSTAAIALALLGVGRLSTRRKRRTSS
jgi:hypothetical protein